MLNFMMTASFKYVVETDEVALDICVRIGDAVTYSCLGGEVHHYGNVIFSEDFIYCFFVCNRGVDKSPGPSSVLPVLGGCYIFDLLETFVFDVDIIIVCYGINTYHFNVLYIVEKTLYEIAADKAGGTCYKNSLALKVYIML